MTKQRTRRSHGEGSVTPRGKNRWRLRYDGLAAEDGTRKQISETFIGVKSKALSTLRERIRSLETGQFVGPSRLTVSEYLKNWLQLHSQNVAPKTAEGYATMIRVYIDPLLGQIRLQSLEPHHLSSLYTSMLEKNLSSATRAHCHRTIRKALGDALRQKLISSNPALSVTPRGNEDVSPKHGQLRNLTSF